VYQRNMSVCICVDAGRSGCNDGTTAGPEMTVKNGAFGLCACVSGEVTWVHSTHTCLNERGSRDFAQGCAELVTASSVQARVTSLPMTRASTE
jgi:hypothetical protein